MQIDFARKDASLEEVTASSCFFLPDISPEQKFPEIAGNQNGFDHLHPVSLCVITFHNHSKSLSVLWKKYIYF